MNEKNPNENTGNPLDSLLETMSMDDTMEKKIHEFSRNKQRRQRIARARQTSAQFTQTYSASAKARIDEENKARLESEKQAARSSLDVPGFASDHYQPSQVDIEEQTVQISTADPQAGLRSQPAAQHAVQHASEQAGGATIAGGRTINASSMQDPHGATIVFGAAESEPDASVEGEGADSHTVVMNENEIASLLQEDEPILKREYFDGLNTGAIKEGASRIQEGAGGFFSIVRSNWKIMAGIIGLVLSLFLIIGGYQLLEGWMTSIRDSQTEENQANYEKLLEWAENYDSLDDEQKNLIADYYKLYSKLSDEQKEKINDLLEAATGKNFNQLLAAAQAANKTENGSNNNTAIAEQKAQIKDQIAQLQSQLNSLQSQYDSARGNVEAAYNEYLEKNDAFVAAQNEYNDAYAQLNDLKSQLAALQSDAAAYPGQLEDLQNRLNTLQSTKPEGDETDNSAEIASLQAQISDIRSAMSSNDSQQREVNRQITDASASMSSLRQDMDNAQAEMSAAKSDYDSVNSSTSLSDLQAQMNSVQAQIASLQSELDTLNQNQ